jgi:hypothetical protein
MHNLRQRFIAGGYNESTNRDHGGLETTSRLPQLHGCAPPQDE